MSIEKGPKCRQADETYNECVSRKVSELIEVDGMEQSQAVAVAQSMCETPCSMKAASVSTGQFVSWSTDKGRYVGQVSGVITSGDVSVVSSSGGQEQVEASDDNPVARVVVYVDNQDGSYEAIGLFLSVYLCSESSRSLKPKRYQQACVNTVQRRRRSIMQSIAVQPKRQAHGRL